MVCTAPSKHEVNANWVCKEAEKCRNLGLFINNKRLESVNTQKLLGVYIDNTLK